LEQTVTTNPQPDRIPIAHSVVYAARGLPEVPNQYGSGTLAPSEITLTYRAAPDSQLGRVHAYVAGRLRVDGVDLPMPNGLYGQHYFDGVTGWPEWLAEEARLHDPAAAVPVAAPPTTEQSALRDRVRRALCEAAGFGFAWGTDMLEPDEYGDVADAVRAVLPAPADRAAVPREAADGEGDELVCVDECGFCNACGYEPFGTPAEGWREAARFLRRTARDSGDRSGALHGARLIEAELRRLADEAEQAAEAPHTATPDAPAVVAQPGKEN
jgi:hypothetical protein